MSILTNYPGAKTNSGIIQFLINNIPVHDRYFELFAGSAQLFRTKRPANVSYLNDVDIDVTRALFNEFGEDIRNEFNSISFVDFVLKYKDNERDFNRDCFLYLDPPYPECSRRNGRKYYKYEMLDNKAHITFLTLCKTIDANIMISTRENDLYDEHLPGWRKKVFNTVDRVGPVQEVIYMNYPEPNQLHQYDYVGEDFTDRQRIKRKLERIVRKIGALPVYERHLIMQALNDIP